MLSFAEFVFFFCPYIWGFNKGVCALQIDKLLYINYLEQLCFPAIGKTFSINFLKLSFSLVCDLLRLNIP